MVHVILYYFSLILTCTDYLIFILTHINSTDRYTKRKIKILQNIRAINYKKGARQEYAIHVLQRII